MANKNSKQRRVQIAKSVKQGNREVTLDRSWVGEHYSNRHTYRNIVVAVPHDTSTSPRRNMQQKVLTNAGGGADSSVTVHVPMDKTRPVRFKNHSYMIKDEHGNNNYKQPAGVRQ